MLSANRVFSTNLSVLQTVTGSEICIINVVDVGAAFKRVYEEGLLKVFHVVVIYNIYRRAYTCSGTPARRASKCQTER